MRTLIAVIAVTGAVFLYAASALAADCANNLVLPGNGKCRALYAKEGAVLKMKTQPIHPDGTAAERGEATLTCLGNGTISGGWQEKCDYAICYYKHPQGIVCDSKNANGKPTFAIQRCPKEPRSEQKEFCSYDAATGLSAPEIEGSTGDDMFRIEKGANGFFEYQGYNAPGLSKANNWQDPWTVKWIRRNNSGPDNPMMMPSGPRNTYEDYKDFINNPPPGVQTAKACSRGTVTMCDANQNAKDGKCGPAQNGFYRNAPPVPDRCDIGKSSNPQKNNNTWLWNWKCDPLRGGDVANCQAKVIVDATCGPAHGQAVYLAGDIKTNKQCGIGDPASRPVYNGVSGWSWRCDPPHHPQTPAASVNCWAPVKNNAVVVSPCLTLEAWEGMGTANSILIPGGHANSWYTLAYGFHPSRHLHDFTGDADRHGVVWHELYMHVDKDTMDYMSIGEAVWGDYMRLWVQNSYTGGQNAKIWDSGNYFAQTAWPNGPSSGVPPFYTDTNNNAWHWAGHPPQYITNNLAPGRNLLYMETLVVNQGSGWFEFQYKCK